DASVCCSRWDNRLLHRKALRTKECRPRLPRVIDRRTTREKNIWTWSRLLGSADRRHTIQARHTECTEADPQLMFPQSYSIPILMPHSNGLLEERRVTINLFSAVVLC